MCSCALSQRSSKPAICPVNVSLTIALLPWWIYLQKAHTRSVPAPVVSGAWYALRDATDRPPSRSTLLLWLIFLLHPLSVYTMNMSSTAMPALCCTTTCSSAERPVLDATGYIALTGCYIFSWGSRSASINCHHVTIDVIETTVALFNPLQPRLSLAPIYIILGG